MKLIIESISEERFFDFAPIYFTNDTTDKQSKCKGKQKGKQIDFNLIHINIAKDIKANQQYQSNNQKNNFDDSYYLRYFETEFVCSFRISGFFRIISMTMPIMAHKLSTIITIIKRVYIKKHNLSYITVNLNLWVY